MVDHCCRTNYQSSKEREFFCKGYLKLEAITQADKGNPKLNILK
jgi:hypothetical protein